MDSDLLHLELFEKRIRKPVLVTVDDGDECYTTLRDQNEATFQIGNEDANYKPARASLRQFEETQNNTSFCIGITSDDLPVTETRQQQDSLKTNKKCFPQKDLRVVKRPPFSVKIDEKQTSPLPSEPLIMADQKLTLNSTKRSFPQDTTVDKPPFGIQSSFADKKEAKLEHLVMAENPQYVITTKRYFPQDTTVDKPPFGIQASFDNGNNEENEPEPLIMAENPQFVNSTKRYFPQDTTVDNPPFCVDEVSVKEPNNGEQASLKHLVSPFKLQKKSAQKICSVQRLGFTTPRSDIGITNNKEQFKERLQQIKQSLTSSSSHQLADRDLSHSPVGSNRLSARRHRTLSDPSLNQTETCEELPSRPGKKLNSKDLHRQYFYQSMMDTERSKSGREKPSGLARARFLSVDITAQSETSRPPPSPKELHKLTYESQQLEQPERKIVASPNAYKNFHHSNVAYGSESNIASLGDRARPNKRVDPVALSLGYRYCDLNSYGSVVVSETSSTTSDLDDVFDGMSLHSSAESKYQTTSQWVNGNLQKVYTGFFIISQLAELRKKQCGGVYFYVYNIIIWMLIQ